MFFWYFNCIFSMMKLTSIFLVLVATFFTARSVSAQIEVSQTEFDLGSVYYDDSRFVDVTFTNKGDNLEWLLSVRKPKEIVYLFNKKKMEPDSSIVLRLQANPTKKGKFNLEVPVFLSDREEAIHIKIKGELKELPADQRAYLQGCPDFGSHPSPLGKTSFNLTVQVRDSLSNEPIRNASLKVYKGYKEEYTFKTDKQGKVVLESTPGPLYFLADADGYNSNEDGEYFNFRRNQFVIKLLPDPEMVTESTPDIEEENKEDEEEITIVINTDEKEETEEEIILEPQPEKPENTENTNKTPLPPLENIPLNDFSDAYFKPVNIVFVVDVSSSMNAKGRIQLLKKTMHNFIDILRPSDKVTVVAFATNTSIFLETTDGTQKSNMHEMVDQIEPKGATAGSAGIELGYEKAEAAFLENGNNQVIIITDGAFNRGDTRYKRIIRRGKRKGIDVAVVGIKNNNYSAERLKEVADLGTGDYFSIESLDDAQKNMILQVKKKAYKGVGEGE